MSRQVRKSWNFESAQSHALHDLLSDLLGKLGTSTIVMVEPGAKTENPALAVRALRAVDLATLPNAANTCHTYVKLGDRDIAIVNDPSSGGASLSEITLVAGACFETSGPDAEVLIAKRISFPARVSQSGKPDDEGVRIPPMPLAKAGKLNTDILTAMSMHPLAPKGMVETIQAACNDLFEVIAKLKQSAIDPGSEIRRVNFKRYLADCTRMLEDRFHRLPLGAKTVTSRLASGETLKLQLRIDESKVHFDFAGTDGSTRVSLTDMQTFSACMAVVASLFADGLPMNSATFSFIQVSAPSRTLLSGRGPVGTVASTSFVFAGVCDLARQAFAQLTPSLRAAAAATANGHFQFEFNDGRFWSSTLQPGSPARAEAAGIDAYAIWEPPRSPFRMDLIEREQPLKIIGCGIREASGGKGLFPGGDGAFYSFEVLAPCKVRWTLGSMGSKIEGVDGGKAGQMAKVEIRRSGQAALESLEASGGVTSCFAGDQIHFFGSGGGGFGEPAADEG